MSLTLTFLKFSLMIFFVLTEPYQSVCKKNFVLRPSLVKGNSHLMGFYAEAKSYIGTPLPTLSCCSMNCWLLYGNNSKNHALKSYSPFSIFNLDIVEL